MSQPRVWLITGCSSGVGLALTEHVLHAGDIVLATCRKPSALDALTAQYPQTQLRVVGLDVTHPAQIRAAFAEAEAAFGRLDVVVNNAGYALLSEIEGTSGDAARRNIEVNFWGAVGVSQEAVRFFREVNPAGAGGRLIQISSGAGIVGWPTCGFYSASKHALEGFSDSLAQELDPAWNIKVTTVPLGAFATNSIAVGMDVLPPHPAYTSPELIAAKIRKAILARGEDPLYQVKGDPAKLARELYRLSELPEPPLRIPLGKEAVAIFKAKIQQMQEQVDQYASWSDNLELDK